MQWHKHAMTILKHQEKFASNSLSARGVVIYFGHLDRKHGYKLPFNFKFMLPFRKVFWPETILYQRCYHEELFFPLRFWSSTYTVVVVRLQCGSELPGELNLHPAKFPFHKEHWEGQRIGCEKYYTFSILYTQKSGWCLRLLLFSR